MNALKLRLLTGAVLLALLVTLLFYAHPTIFIGSLILAGFLGIHELFRLFEVNLLESTGVILCLSLYAWGTILNPELITLQSLVLLGLIILLYKKGCDSNLKQDMKISLCLGYGVCLTASLVALWLLHLQSAWLAAGLFAIVAGMDIGGYVIGRLWGERQLCPSISPGKTIEGAMGGLALVIAVGALIACSWPLEWLTLFKVSVITSVFAVAGDLLESWLKRIVGAKDSGTLLPGHGGIPDRIDGIILAAPIYWFLSL